VRALHPDWGEREILEYNLRNDGREVSIFEETQNYRIRLTRTVIQDIIDQYPGERLRIVEPACSAGDLAGYFSSEHEAIGCDIVPAAVEATRSRYPKMTVEQGKAEAWEPRMADILIMCEFLEHIADPIGFVSKWAPLARHMVISHPLVRDGFDPEVGHFWAYYDEDFRNWFPLGGHRLVHWTGFKMGYEMIVGRGDRA